MTYLIITLILLQILPYFKVKVHTHPTYREYGVRYVVDKPALVISVGKLIWRIERASN